MLRYLLKSAKVQYVILGPAGFASETFRVFIDLFAFLRSIRGSPDARKEWKIKLMRTSVNVLSFLSFLWRLKLLGYILNSRICD